MAKGKSVNPAEAFRKAIRKKELKKNKSERQKNREFALVKTDTTEIEEEVTQLEAKKEPSALEQARLKELKADLERINKKKEAYVAEHPEHRRLVYRPKKRSEDEVPPAPVGPVTRNLFKKNGLPKHPERSIYYDPVMNPFGVAPPGMPYMERPLRTDEVDSEEEEDVVMPEGPPPGAADDDEDSDDDIPMPDGPPPSQEPAVPQVPTFAPLPPGLPPRPGLYPPLMPQFYGSSPPHPVLGLPPPPPPMKFPQSVPHPPSGLPPLPPGFPMPPAPPGFFPFQKQSSNPLQDPLSRIPHQTYQASRSQPPPPQPPSQASGSFDPSSAVTAAATISAAPELRDLKKESTAFLPTALKRKKAAAGPSSAKLNAAPSIESSSTEDAHHAGPARPDLLGSLRDQFGVPPVASELKKAAKGGQSSDDYQKFKEEMGDIL